MVATLQQLMQFQERALDRETNGGAGSGGGGGAASGKTLAAKKKRVVWHCGTCAEDLTAANFVVVTRGKNPLILFFVWLECW